MKKILSILLVTVTALLLASCSADNVSENEQSRDIKKADKILFPAYEEENPDNLPYIDEINRTPEFQVEGDFPENWVLKDAKPEETLPPGDFYNLLYIYDNDRLAGYIGFNRFEPYTEEIEPELYYQTVWPSLRLSSFFSWEPFASVTRTETSETGIADIWYLDPEEIEKYPGAVPNIPTIETNGILSYNKELSVYIGIAFMPDSVDREQLENLAESIKISIAEQAK